MKKIKFGVLLLILSTILLPIFSKNNFAKAQEQESDKINILFFYGSGCPHCEEVKPFLTSFEEKYKSSVEVFSFDVYANDQEVIDLYNLYSKKYYSKSNGVPALFIADKMLVGSDPIIEGLRPSLTSCQGECGLKISLIDAVRTIRGELEEPNAIDSENNKVLTEEDIKKYEDINFLETVNLAGKDAVNFYILVSMIILAVLLLRVDNFEKKYVFKIGRNYIAGLLVAFYLVALGMFGIEFLYDVAWTKWILTVLGLTTISAGIFGLFQVYYPGTSFNSLFKKTWKKIVPFLAIALGVTTAIFQLPYVAPYYKNILDRTPTNSLSVPIWYLLVYSLIFILPLAIILALTIFGFDMEKHADIKKIIRITAEVALIIVGIILIV